MTLPFLALLVAASGLSFSLLYYFQVRALNAAASHPAPVNVAGRYRPMLRLLSESDIEFVGVNAKARKAMRAERRKLFRGYLACLTRDYGRLLAGVRHAIVLSGTDRPELVRAIAKNRTFFALAVCRIQYGLALHALGIGTVDISVLVRSFDTLRDQLAIFSQTPDVAMG